MHASTWCQISSLAEGVRQPFWLGLPDPGRSASWSYGLVCLPPVAWKENVDSHAHLLTQGHQSLMRRCHQPQQVVPRQTFVTPEVLMHVRFRRFVRQRLRETKSRHRLAFRFTFFRLLRYKRVVGLDFRTLCLQETCAARVLALMAKELQWHLRAGKRACLTSRAHRFSQEAAIGTS